MWTWPPPLLFVYQINSAWPFWMSFRYTEIQMNELDSVPTYSCLPTINRPLTDHLLTDHLPTTYRPLTDHLPTAPYRPPTDNLPTTYCPPACTDHLLTTYRPSTNHLLTTYRPLFYGAACSRLPTAYMLEGQHFHLVLVLISLLFMYRIVTQS